MDLTEYEKESKKLKNEMTVRQKVIDKNYAISQRLANIGDVIQTEQASMKVEAIGWVSKSSIDGLPCCIYTGVKLKVNGEPYKSGELIRFSNNTLISVNGNLVNA